MSVVKHKTDIRKKRISVNEGEVGLKMDKKIEVKIVSDDTAPLWFHCLHILYCYIFLAIDLCTGPTLNYLVHIQDRMYRSFP